MRKTLISVLLSLSVISVADGLEDLTNLYMYSFQALGEEWEKQEREEQQRREMRQNNPELVQQEYRNQKQQRKAWLKAEGYVDLGLPSGTLWKQNNEGDLYSLYIYREAVKKFGNKMPSKEQWEELIRECTWSWEDGRYKVTGPNGNSILLRAAGHRNNKTNEKDGVNEVGYYWSSTSSSDTFASCIVFGAGGMFITDYFTYYAKSVRLVDKY